MPQIKPREFRVQAPLALLLALVGGYVDAVGYLLLFQLFTAHMSGNSIAMTVHAGEGDWAAALHRAFPIPVFVAGVVAGAALSEALHRRGVRPVLAAPFGLQALLLALFILCGAAVYRDGALRPDDPWVFYLLAALPALAMGLQNAALRHVGGLGVRTTYITGMLTNFAEEAVQYAYWLRDEAGAGGLRAALGQSARQQTFRGMVLYLGVWAAYVAGGVTGAFAELQWRLPALWAPAIVLVGVAVADLIRPLAPGKRAADRPEWKL